MKKLFKYCLLIVFIFLTFLTSAFAADEEITTPYFLNDSTQMVVVITPSWNSPNGKLLRFSRKSINSPWKLIGGKTSVIVGKSGLGWSGEYRKFDLHGPYKKEGDYKAPAGAFGLGPAFGFNKPEKDIKLYYLPIVKTTVCVDDPNSKFYGRIIDSEKIAQKQKDWKRAEHMVNYPGYKYGVMIDYNMGERQPDIGSCIFLHVINARDKDGTRGSTILPEHTMLNLLTWLNPKRNPVLIQMPKLQYQHLEKAWKLPHLPS